MRIDLPSLEVMRAVESCKQLWNRLSNDEYFEFRAYLRYATGADISVYGSESPAEWVRAQRLIDALERSVGFANLLLPHEPMASDMLRLTDWLEQTVEPARFDVEMKVLQRLLSHLGQRLVGMSNRNDDRIDNLIRARQITVHDERFSREEFDAFISYKQRDYADVASRLYQALTERGFHCWLDVEELRLVRTTRVDDLTLKYQLRRALSVCRHTVFFEMAQEATMDENVRGEHETFLWQSFEQRYARGLVYVSPSTNRVDTGMGEKLGEWSSVEELANVLADRFQSVTVSDPAPEPGPRRGDEPNLTEARTALLTWAEEYLGHRIDMTPMAVLALLAPGKEDNLTSGSDVLINLLRYDPLAARAFMDAEVDLFKLFAVGVEINHRRWIAPRKWLMEDVCGFADQGAPTPAEPGRRSCLGTADVLHGLLRGAQRRHKQRDLLELTLRWMHPDESSEDRERRCNALIEDLLARAAEGRDRFGRHGWLFLEHERAWTAEPVMLCEQAGNSIVLQVQTPRLFPTELREALARAAFDSIETVRTEYPEVSLTLRPPLFVSTAAYLSRPAADPATLLFSLDGVRRLEEWPGSGASVIDAPSRKPALDLPFGPAEWHRAVLATDEVPSTASSSDPPSYQELAFQTLTPLAAHASIRDLEFDDI